ncbi:MAG: hypothetical protein ACOX6Y_09030 [Christensenellales bacterium]
MPGMRRRWKSIALRLLGFLPQRDSFAALAFQLDNLLFMQVREDTEGRMTLIMDNEQAVRLRMNDFSLMADELMYLLFEALPKNAANQAPDPQLFHEVRQPLCPQGPCICCTGTCRIRRRRPP